MSSFRTDSGAPVLPVWNYAAGLKPTLAGAHTPAIGSATYVWLYNAHASNTYWYRADGVAPTAATQGSMPLLAGQTTEVAIPTGGSLKLTGTGDIYIMPAIVL